MSAKAFDLIVIGAGPGGYVAAIRAAQLGKKVVIVERESLGGICLNWGCIPTKAMLRSSEVFHLMHRAKEFGLAAENITYDLDAVVKRSRGVAKQLSSGIGHLMKKNKITVVMGEATIPASGQVTVKTDKGSEDLTAPDIVLATGARARELPGLEADGARVWSYRHALVPPHMPKKLLVIGSGAAGLNAAVQLRNQGIEDVLIVTEGLKMGTSINTGSDKQTYYKTAMCGNDLDAPLAMAKNFFSKAIPKGWGWRSWASPSTAPMW